MRRAPFSPVRILLSICQCMQMSLKSNEMGVFKYSSSQRMQTGLSAELNTGGARAEPLARL